MSLEEFKVFRPSSLCNPIESAIHCREDCEHQDTGCIPPCITYLCCFCGSFSLPGGPTSVPILALVLCLTDPKSWSQQPSMLPVHQAICPHTACIHASSCRFPRCCYISSEDCPLSFEAAQFTTDSKMPSQQALVKALSLAAAACAPDPMCSTGRRAGS